MIRILFRRTGFFGCCALIGLLPLARFCRFHTLECEITELNGIRSILLCRLFLFRGFSLLHGALCRDLFFFRFSCRSRLGFRRSLLRQTLFFFLLLLCFGDPATDLLQYFLCIVQPLDRPDAHRPPAQSRQYRRLHRKTVCRRLIAAHIFSVQQDAQQVILAIFRIHDPHIQTVFRTAHVRTHFVSEAAYFRSDLAHHRILVYRLRTALGRDHTLSVLCKFQKALQSGNAFGSGTADVDLLRPQYGIHDHLFSCTGDRHIQSAPAAVTVQRSEVHRDLTVFVRSVTDGEEDHIPLIALYVFQVLDKYRLCRLPVPLFQFRMRHKCFGQ